MGLSAMGSQLASAHFLAARSHKRGVVDIEKVSRVGFPVELDRNVGAESPWPLDAAQLRVESSTTCFTGQVIHVLTGALRIFKIRTCTRLSASFLAYFYASARILALPIPEHLMMVVMCKRQHNRHSVFTITTRPHPSRATWGLCRCRMSLTPVVVIVDRGSRLAVSGRSVVLALVGIFDQALDGGLPSFHLNSFGWESEKQPCTGQCLGGELNPG